METTFSMFSAPESRALQTSLPLAAPPKQGQSLTEKYRPQKFSDVVGQGYAIMKLTAYLEFPHPTAFIFSGETGIGKTSLALCLANELGINRDWGLRHIKSGELDVEEVRAALDQLRFACPCGSGWKMIIADEADLMGSKSKGLWLSGLEDIPPKSIIIFTTNEPDKFPARFLDRCEHIRFEDSARTILQDAQVLLNRIWIGENLQGPPPSVERFPGIVNNGRLSFRRVVRAIEEESRRQTAQRAARPVERPVSGAGKATLTVSQHIENKARVVL